MKLDWKITLGTMAVIAMGMPAWAHTNSVNFVTTQPTNIAGVQLAPGSYELKADDSKNQVTVEMNGSVVTQVPCKWIQLPQKAGQSEVQTNDSGVTELLFAGKTEAATVDGQ